MMGEDALLASAIREYETTVRDTGDDMSDEKLIEILVKDHDWTEGGARAVVELAERYGAFMLRNALAVAVVLQEEDGELGY